MTRDRADVMATAAVQIMEQCCKDERRQMLAAYLRDELADFARQIHSEIRLDDEWAAGTPCRHDPAT